MRARYLLVPPVPRPFVPKRPRVSSLRTDLERRIVAAVDGEGLVRAAQRLVRIRSDGGHEVEAQKAVSELMSEHGLIVDQWEIDLPEVQRHEAASWEIERKRALGVVGSLRGHSRDGPTLVLNGHVDVVPAGQRNTWTHPPFDGVIDDGRLYGRGALDMKGPLVAGLFALSALRRAGVELDGTAILHSVVGEEDGGIGTLASILRGHTGDAAIVLEPTRMVVAPVQSGCINVRIAVPGIAAHGAIRTEGVSALEKLHIVHRAVIALEDERNRPFRGAPLYRPYPTPFPICIGTVRGGSWASSVPDLVTVEGRVGVLPGETMADARLAFENAVEAAAENDDFLRDHPPKVEWWGGRFYPVNTPVDSEVVTTLASALMDVRGEAAPFEAVPFGADAGLFAHVADMPAVLFGAGDIRRAHAPDEFIDIDELVEMSRVLALAVARFCGVR